MGATPDAEPLGRKIDASTLAKSDFGLGAGAAGTGAAVATLAATVCRAITFDRLVEVIGGSVTEFTAVGDSSVATVTLLIPADGDGVLCTGESGVDNSSVRSENAALEDLEVVVTLACSGAACSAAAVAGDSVSSSCGAFVARVERRSSGSTDTRSRDSSEEATASDASGEESRVERDTESRREFGNRSREESETRNRSADDFNVRREASRADCEFDSRDVVDARGPSADAPGELFSPLSAKAVPVDDASATPIPSAIDRALNWPMYKIFAVRDASGLREAVARDRSDVCRYEHSESILANIGAADIGAAPGSRSDLVYIPGKTSCDDMSTLPYEFVALTQRVRRDSTSSMTKASSGRTHFFRHERNRLRPSTKEIELGYSASSPGTWCTTSAPPKVCPYAGWRADMVSTAVACVGALAIPGRAQRVGFITHKGVDAGGWHLPQRIGVAASKSIGQNGGQVDMSMGAPSRGADAGVDQSHSDFQIILGKVRPLSRHLGH